MKKSNYFRIKLPLSKMTPDEVCDLGSGMKVDGDSVVTVVTYDDTTRKAAVKLVRDDIDLRVTIPSKTLTKTEQQHLNDLAVIMETTKNEAEVQANKFAAGNRVLFDQVVTRVGLMPRAQAAAHEKGFMFKKADANSFHVVAPAPEKGRYTAYFLYGFTTAVGTPPPTFEPQVALPVCELITGGIPNGTIVGLMYAVLIHPKHTKKTASKIKQPDNVTPVGKALNVPTVNNKGKIVITHGVPFLHWSDIIYYTVTGTELSGSIKG